MSQELLLNVDNSFICLKTTTTTTTKKQNKTKKKQKKNKTNKKTKTQLSSFLNVRHFLYIVS
jgi:hypothetical protein